MDNFFKWNFTSRYRLIGKINGLSDDVRRTRFRLVERAKADKPIWVLETRKRVVGADIRHHLLAYAFMRGTDYSKLERNCREDNRPDSYKILDIVKMHGPERGWTLEQVRAWIGKVPDAV